MCFVVWNQQRNEVVIDRLASSSFALRNRCSTHFTFGQRSETARSFFFLAISSAHVNETSSWRFTTSRCQALLSHSLTWVDNDESNNDGFVYISYWPCVPRVERPMKFDTNRLVNLIYQRQLHHAIDFAWPTVHATHWIWAIDLCARVCVKLLRLLFLSFFVCAGMESKSM